MIWDYATDSSYFSDENNKEKYDLINPDLLDIRLFLYSGKVPRVLASYLPPDEIKPIYSVNFLPNKHKGFATQDIEAFKRNGIDWENDKLSAVSFIGKEKFGIDVFKSSITLEDVGGMFVLKDYIKKIIKLDELGIQDFKIKGVFLTGIPGTGKSFTAKAMAGESGRVLASLNLSKILDTDSPVYNLLKIFELLESLEVPVVLWIDEIEKVFTGSDFMERRIMGQLLNILNDLNTPEGFQIDAVFWATANDIKNIVEKDSAFLRKGRFDELFFVNTPKSDEAVDIFLLYIKKMLTKNGVLIEGVSEKRDNGVYVNEEVAKNLLSAIVTKINAYWKNQARGDVDIDTTRFVYTPAEISHIVKEFRNFIAEDMLNGKTELSVDINKIVDISKQIKPIQFAMSNNIKFMRSQRAYMKEV